MKRAGTITGWYAVRLSGCTLTANCGWALYKRLAMAKLRAGFEGHGSVTYMTQAQADTIILKEEIA